MTSNNNLDALSQDAELPFGHPGRRSDDTPEGFEPFALGGPGTGARLYAGRIRQGDPLRPLCGNESMTAVYTDDPNAVAGCHDCLELVAEDLEDHNWPIPSSFPPSMRSA